MAGRAGNPHAGASSASWLVCQQGACRVALPPGRVIETLRPLRIDPMTAMPPFVLGLAVVRGAPIPVVDLGILLGSKGLAAGRWVIVSADRGCVALAVESVAGMQDLSADILEEVPPLARGAADGMVAALGALDAQLLVVLESARLLTEQQWLSVTAQGHGR